MEHSRSREGSPIEKNNKCKNEIQKGFDEDKKAATAHRVADLHKEFTGKCQDITKLMLNKVQLHNHKDTS